MGDGVNIAARLEGIAEPGAICLSEDAYRQVKARLDLAVTDLGPTQLKNIAEPIRVYSLEVGKPFRAKSAPTPAPEKSAPPRLSMVVLPFVNMGGGAEQEHFVDGITESLTTDLSRNRGSFVIRRNTAFTYKGKAVDLTVFATAMPETADTTAERTRGKRQRVRHHSRSPPIERLLRVDLTRSPRSSKMTAICGCGRGAGVDVSWSLRIAKLDVAMRGAARSRRKGVEEIACHALGAWAVWTIDEGTLSSTGRRRHGPGADHAPTRARSSLLVYARLKSSTYPSARDFATNLRCGFVRSEPGFACADNSCSRSCRSDGARCSSRP